jgi:hypothetical protein
MEAMAATTTAELQLPTQLDNSNDSAVAANTPDDVGNSHSASSLAQSNNNHADAGARTTTHKVWRAGLACGLLVVIVVVTLVSIFCDKDGCQWVPPITARA